MRRTRTRRAESARQLSAGCVKGTTKIKALFPLPGVPHEGNTHHRRENKSCLPHSPVREASAPLYIGGMCLPACLLLPPDIPMIPGPQFMKVPMKPPFPSTQNSPCVECQCPLLACPLRAPVLFLSPFRSTKRWTTSSVLLTSGKSSIPPKIPINAECKKVPPPSPPH